MSREIIEETKTEKAVATAKPELKEPARYKVFLLNDDYTPMDFVVTVLQRYFWMDEAEATRIMLQVHTQGKGICGVFTRDVAETKVAQVNDFARSHDYPLLCDMEQE